MISIFSEKNGDKKLHSTYDDIASARQTLIALFNRLLESRCKKIVLEEKRLTYIDGFRCRNVLTIGDYAGEGSLS